MAVFKIHEKDNVAVAVSPVSKGETVTVGNTTLTALDDIPAGHKLAVVPIAKGQDVVKYGFPIGTAKETFPLGPGPHAQRAEQARRPAPLHLRAGKSRPPGTDDGQDLRISRLQAS